MRQSLGLLRHLARPQRHFSSASAVASSKARNFRKILIANRGEIALRVQRSAHKMQIETVAIYSDADAHAQHVKHATEAYRVGPAAAAESYLNYHKILEIAKRSGAEAIHPGYGFLSENAGFCKACADAGIEFIGPPVKAIEAMGSKSASKEIMINAGVPVTPGYHGTDQSFERLSAEAEKVGYPVLIKAVLGGGGKGMRIVDSADQLQEAIDACVREAQASFGDGRVLIEKYLRKPRHVELQVFGDKYGNVVHFFERDCSVQRRHQKVLEEAPAPHMTPELRKKMGDAAVAAAKAVGYVGAGTVEFLLDEDESFYFMEMNTRLQVEHPVTEMITKQDLVELQLKIAAGQPLPLKQDDLKIHGHAIEARIYAENPYNNFLPGSGPLAHVRLPQISEDVRVDTGVIQGDEVSIFYDPMIAKLIVHGPNREKALSGLVKALKEYQIVGLPTNIEFVARTASHPKFQEGGVDTSFLEKYGEDVLKPLERYPAYSKALAAVSLLLREKMLKSGVTARAKATSVWNADHVQHFRSVETLERSIKLQENDQEKEEEVVLKCLSNSSYVVQVGDKQLSVQGELQANGDFEFVVDNRRFNGSAVVYKDHLHLFCNDGSEHYEYNFLVPVPSLEASAGASDGKALKSKIKTPMPGKIVKTLVKQGDQIKANQALLIMEAMKMEHVIRATRDGSVEEILCESGDFVTDGQLLIQLA